MLESALVAIFATAMLSTNSGNKLYVDIGAEMLTGKECRALIVVHAPNSFFSPSLPI